MKVICIDNNIRGLSFSTTKLPLTIGEMYEVFDVEHVPFSPSRYDDPSGPFYKIKCDDGNYKMLENSRFRDLTIDEKREIRLEDLGI